MSILHRSQRLGSILTACLTAAGMMAALLCGLGWSSTAFAAPIQDDVWGYWTDTFADSVGLTSTVNVIVNAAQDRLELIAPMSISQTDWSGGAGLVSTTLRSARRYDDGIRVNPNVTGELALGFTLPILDDTTGLEQDGYNDLIITNYYSGTQDIDGDVAEESFIFYGSVTGLTDSVRATLPVVAAAGAATADLDNDGFLDITIARGHQTDSNGPAYIYWGGEDGYTSTSRTDLDSAWGSCSTVADFDQDGYLDIVICNFTDSSLNPHTDSFIYWGSSSGYATTNRTGLPTVGSIDGYAADLNQDGYLDLVFTNYLTSVLPSLSIARDSYVYWGSSAGFTTANRISLPTVGAHGASVADLNRDGYLDLVFSNRHTDGPLTEVTTTFAISSYVYWGGAAGFTTSNRLELPTIGNYANSVADLNGDGYPEIIFSNHFDGITHAINSYIYWNVAGTFTTSNRTELPTLGAAGNCVSDLNLDGYLDIVFANRRLGNNHNVSSYIYWGSSSGYTLTQRTSLSTHGALGCSIAGGTIAAANMTYGNVYAVPITGTTTVTDTAVTPRIYATSGVLTSTGFDSSQRRAWQEMTWTTTLPVSTSIALDVATSDDGSAWSAWSLVSASSVSGTNRAALNVADAQWIRYRATLTASLDHRQTPILRDLTIMGGQKYGNVASVVITPASIYRWDIITWTAQVTAGQAITLQVLDSNGNLISDGALAGNSAGFSSSPVDISSLSTSTFSSLALQAWFSGNVATSPSLEDWSITWKQSADLHMSNLAEWGTTSNIITFTLIYTNNGPGAAQAVLITNTLPDDVTFAGQAHAEPSLSGPTQIGQALVWYTPTLRTGITGTLVLTVTINPGVSGILTNTGTITTTAFDSSSINNSSYVTLEVSNGLPTAVTLVSFRATAQVMDWRPHWILIEWWNELLGRMFTRLVRPEE